MNLSPGWIDVLRAAGHDAVHWSSVGTANAKDIEILRAARNELQVLLTHDLDFAVLLAQSRGTGPSVLQVRTQDVLPDAIGDLILSVLRVHEAALNAGALVSVDESSSRVRILPIK
jgi:predicted nuclease of predicted toxin-antitoxin system